MVFLPVGKEGILVVLGGVNVADPVWLVPNGERLLDVPEDELIKDEVSMQMLPNCWIQSYRLLTYFL